MFTICYSFNGQSLKKRMIRDYGLKLYYFNNWPNFCDLLNEDIISSIKIDFEFASFQNADLCSLGSIFDKLITNSNIGESDKKMQHECEINKPIHIWGTCLMFDYDNLDQTCVRPFIIHAPRGEKTRKRLSDILGEDISCVLADSGILAPVLVEPCEKKYSVGIVPPDGIKRKMFLKECSNIIQIQQLLMFKINPSRF